MNLEQDPREGEVLLIDKPEGWTSFDVVKKIRGILQHHYRIKKLKVGHAGTLDPAATGLLIICTGKLTKQIDTYQGQEKEYEGSFRLGATTPSLDRETPVEEEFPTEHITKDAVHNTAAHFTGEQQQLPPAYSALKVNGQRAYQKARKGEVIELRPRTVTIHEFDIIDVSFPEVTFRVTCSKGTYIRSLARDMGRALQSGAFLTTLRRIRIGDLTIAQAMTIRELEERLQAEA